MFEKIKRKITNKKSNPINMKKLEKKALEAFVINQKIYNKTFNRYLAIVTEIIKDEDSVKDVQKINKKLAKALVGERNLDTIVALSFFLTLTMSDNKNMEIFDKLDEFIKQKDVDKPYIR